MRHNEACGCNACFEVTDLDAAIAWAARSPTALHETVEVRPIMEGTWLTLDIEEFVRRQRPPREP